MVSVVHLRDIPGARPANKHYPEAEYEFLIYAINPEESPNPEPDDPQGYPALHPMDVVVQFHGINDADAVRLCHRATKAIMEGSISPDQDYRSIWKQLIPQIRDYFAKGGSPLN